MAEPDRDPKQEPIVNPHLIRLLRKRPKLLNIEVRDKFLENLEETIKERRKPRNIGGIMIDRVQEASRPVADDFLEDRLSEANEKLFRRL